MLKKKPEDFFVSSNEDKISSALRIKWFGTAGYELSYEDCTILIDPYVTRVSFWKFLRKPLDPDLKRIAQEIKTANAIFVSHSHFDHVLDVPSVAKTTGAKVYGSQSTANFLKLSSVPDEQIVCCEGRKNFEIGPFNVTLIPSRHSVFRRGGRELLPGHISPSSTLPMRARDYMCGDVFGFKIRVRNYTIGYLGSANLIDEEIAGGKVDMAIVCIAGRHTTKHFVERLMKGLKPETVMPTHYDNFFKPAKGATSLLPFVRFGRFVKEVESFDPKTKIRTMSVGGSISVPVV
ncbi:MAG: MBL fold metallo-hydrolase [Pseudomonadota bacterium]